MWKCCGCGKLIEEKYKFCFECYQEMKLMEDTFEGKKCAKCGKKIRIGYTYCYDCAKRYGSRRKQQEY